MATIVFRLYHPLVFMSRACACHAPSFVSRARPSLSKTKLSFLFYLCRLLSVVSGVRSQWARSCALCTHTVVSFSFLFSFVFFFVLDPADAPAAGGAAEKRHSLRKKKEDTDGAVGMRRRCAPPICDDLFFFHNGPLRSTFFFIQEKWPPFLDAALPAARPDKGDGGPKKKESNPIHEEKRGRKEKKEKKSVPKGARCEQREARLPSARAGNPEAGALRKEAGMEKKGTRAMGNRSGSPRGHARTGATRRAGERHTHTHTTTSDGRRRFPPRV